MYRGDLQPAFRWMPKWLLLLLGWTIGLLIYMALGLVFGICDGLYGAWETWASDMDDVWEMEN